MDKEQAYKIGLAFKLGMIYAKGKAHAKLTNDSKLALDDPKWITVHPNGKENGFRTQRSRELAKRLRLPQNNTTTANKTLSANKNNGSVASVLNVPDASKWNNKIYNYRNGEKAVFINNQKIVLNAEQYKKLKELAGK